MRQSGILAEAHGIYALDHNLARLEDDHRRALTLATAIAGVRWSFFRIKHGHGSNEHDLCKDERKCGETEPGLGIKASGKIPSLLCIK